jgi:large subunit ribosomal protein L25
MPAVVYGDSGQSAGTHAISVDPKTLSRILHSESGANTLIALRIDGLGESQVLVKDYQLDPVTHQLLHADFYRVALDREITVTVPVVLRGEARGVKQQGGLLDFVHREIEIEVLPTRIPENIEIDVSELMLGQAVRLRDITEGRPWKPVSDLDLMLVHVVTPKAEEPAPAEAAAAVPAIPAEPEVIKKGKADKDEDEE